MVDALVGASRPFTEHIYAASELGVRRAGLDPALVGAAAQRAARLDQFPDAPAALDRLRQAGHTLVMLTNSGAQGGRPTLQSAGIAGSSDRFPGVDAVAMCKPHGATYAHA